MGFNLAFKGLNDCVNSRCGQCDANRSLKREYRDVKETKERETDSNIS